MRHVRRAIHVAVGSIVLALPVPSASRDGGEIHNADTFDPWPFPGDLDRDLEVGFADLLGLLPGRRRQ